MFESFIYPAISAALIVSAVIVLRFWPKRDTHPMGERPSWRPQQRGFPPRPPEPPEEDAPWEHPSWWDDNPGTFTCFFCEQEYDTDDVSDYWCYGCEHYVCLTCTAYDEGHTPGHPCGPHTASDHPAICLKIQKL